MERKISIIIPVYNVEKYIKICIESVINQTYKNLEILVINDGTKDKSFEIIESYLGDKRIKVINREKNSGIAVTRNIGISQATGEYIFFIDADDYLEINAIENLIEALNDEDIIGGNFFYYDEIKKNKTENIIKNDENSLMDSKKYFFNQASEIVVWNKLYRRSFLIENNLKFTEGIIHEDEEFSFNCYISSSKVKYIDKITYNYRINRENSIMDNIRKKQNVEYSIKSLEKILENLKLLKLKKNTYFIKIRVLLRVLELQNIIFERKRKIISKKEILKFEKELREIKLDRLTFEEKIMVNKILRNIILKREFLNLNLLNKFYWENGILKYKDLRKILSRKLRNLSTREGY